MFNSYPCHKDIEIIPICALSITIKSNWPRYPIWSIACSVSQFDIILVICNFVIVFICELLNQALKYWRTKKSQQPSVCLHLNCQNTHIPIDVFLHTFSKEAMSQTKACVRWRIFFNVLMFNLFLEKCLSVWKQEKM